MRRLLLLACLFLLSAGGQYEPAVQFDYWHDRLNPFHQEYASFIRELQGCPARGPISEAQTECSPINGRVNLKRWNKVRRLAKRAFEIE